jgi:hypothetical protein
VCLLRAQDGTERLVPVVEFGREAHCSPQHIRGDLVADGVITAQEDSQQIAAADDALEPPMRDFAGSRHVQGRSAAQFERSPHLALLSTARDRPDDWLRAGQAMEHVLLLATLEGLSNSFVTQALEWTDLRWPLRDPISGSGHVQMVLRLGYGPKGTNTPRRPVTEVLDIQP